MNVWQLVNALNTQPFDADVRVDVGGDVRQIARVTILHDGEDIVLIVPKEA